MCTAHNKLKHIRQGQHESLRKYIDRIKTALAALDRATTNLVSPVAQAEVIKLNSATAKNIFESWLHNKELKTAVIAAKSVSLRVIPLH